jgi:acetyl-CoA carboxylase biotin carboxyl carrier protein
VKKRAVKQGSSRQQADRDDLIMLKNNHLDSEVHHLVDLLNRHQLAELEIEHKGLRIRVRRGGSADTAMVMTESSRQALNQSGAAIAQAVAPDSLTTVTSPIVGTFYRSASPDADAYVDEGDFVKKGQVLCIVEAMKLMNEIESEMDGRVHKILAESAKPVEYGQPLFLIDSTATP